MKKQFDLKKVHFRKCFKKKGDLSIVYVLSQMFHLDTYDKLGECSRFLNICNHHSLSTEEVEFPGSVRWCWVW